MSFKHAFENWPEWNDASASVLSFFGSLFDTENCSIILSWAEIEWDSSKMSFSEILSKSAEFLEFDFHRIFSISKIFQKFSISLEIKTESFLIFILNIQSFCSSFYLKRPIVILDRLGPDRDSIVTNYRSVTLECVIWILVDTQSNVGPLYRLLTLNCSAWFFIPKISFLNASKAIDKSFIIKSH